VRAITLSDKEVLAIAFKSAELSDRKKRVAPSEEQVFEAARTTGGSKVSE
jgi:hypothetical protein